MPRVPIYDEPQVALRPLPNVAIEAPRSNLPELGEALQRAGASIGDVALRQQQQANVDAVMRAEAALKDEYLQFESSIRERRGVNAWNATNDAAAWWSTKLNEWLGELENDEQRRVFRELAGRLREQSLTAISRHEAEERRAAVEESTKASIASSIALAAAHAADPQARATARDDVLRRVQMLALTNGWTPERQELEARQQLTELHRQVLENLANTDAEAAAEYFETHRGEIDGARLDELDRVVRAGTTAARAQAAVDEILASGATELEALAAARTKYSGDLEDEVVRRLQARFAEQRAAAEVEQRRLADEAWSLFARGGLDAVPPSLRAKLDGRTLLALEREEAARTRGVPVETNWELYLSLREQAARDPAAFAQLDLRQFFSGLNDPERRALISLQEDVRNPGTRLDVATFQQQLANAHELLGLTGTKHAELRGRFDTVVSEAVQAEQRKLGRPLSFEERQRVIDRMMIEGRTGWFFTDHLYEVVGTERERDFVPIVPENQRDRFAQVLAENGYPVTDETIRALFIVVHNLPGADEARALLTGRRESTEEAVRISSDDEYDALPSGTRFIAPDGTTRIKP